MMTTPVFDIEKSINAILYVANHLTRKDFHKIFKVLYFADRNHLSNYGRTITGDSYIAMDDGPVPSKIYDIFKIVRGDSLYSSERKHQFEPYFAVQNWMIVVPKQQANTDYLSESDLEELNNSLSLYGNLSWDEVREKSHDFAWRSTVKDHTIDLQNIMRENGEVEEYINFVTEHINLQKACL